MVVLGVALLLWAPRSPPQALVARLCSMALLAVQPLSVVMLVAMVVEQAELEALPQVLQVLLVVTLCSLLRAVARVVVSPLVLQQPLAVLVGCPRAARLLLLVEP